MQKVFFQNKFMNKIQLTYLSLSPECNNQYRSLLHKLLLEVLNNNDEIFKDLLKDKFDMLRFYIVNKKDELNFSVIGPTVLRNKRLIEFTIYIPCKIDSINEYTNYIICAMLSIIKIDNNRDKIIQQLKYELNAAIKKII